MRLTALALSLACALSLSAQQAPNPEWERLKAGNTLFRGDSITFNNLQQTRRDNEPPRGQTPSVIVLSCSDSRVPPELVFKQTLGEIFLVRSAGNVTDSLGIASIEYALTRPLPWKTKLLLVLAHEDCGAVKFAMGSRPNPSDERNRNFIKLYDAIRPSFQGSCPNPNDEKACLAFRAKQNARRVVAQLTGQSQIIRDAINNGLPVGVAYYKLDGSLEVLVTPPPPRQ